MNNEGYHARSWRGAARAGGVSFLALVAGCVAILGDDYEVVEAGGAGGTTTGTTTTTTSETTTSSTTTSSTTTTPVVTCSNPSECDSGFCVDGFCCDASCADPCVACDVEGHEGVCSPTASGSAEPACDPGLCDGAGQCVTGDALWAYNYGDAAGQWGRNVTVDSDGNVISVGHYDGTINFGDGAHSTTLSDMYVTKHTSDGTLVWSRVFGNSDNATEFPQAVAADSAGNITIAGTFNGTITFGATEYTASAANHFDIFMVKLDPNGTVLWSDAFATESNDFFFSTLALDVTPGGAIVLAASVVGGVDLGGGTMTSIGGWDFVVGGFDPNGSHQWSSRYGGVGGDAVADVAFDSAGDVLVTGFFSGVVDFDVPDGELTAAGGVDAFLLKLEGGGSGQWVRAWGDHLGQSGLGVSADAERNVLLAGSWAGSIDFGGGPRFTADSTEPFVVKLTPAGDYLWDARAGDTATDGWATTVEATAGGAIVVGGWFAGTASFGGPPMAATAASVDAFVVKLGPDGGFVWGQSFGTDLAESVQGLALDPNDDSIAITGYMGAGTMTIGLEELVSAGSADVFVAKLAP